MSKDEKSNIDFRDSRMGSISWDDYQFGQLEENNMFYMNRNRDTSINPSFRKIDKNTAMNLFTRKLVKFEYNQKVYQKEY